MEKSGVGPKLQQLENFLTRPESEESKNYINDMITKETARTEDLFVHKFLNYDFWREMGFSDKETKIEDTAGTKGRVEIAFHIEGQKIAVECKRPYLLKKGEAVINELDGNDILELKTQISDYLISHSFVVFTNGFHWFFYSRESYSLWLRNKDKKNNQLKPYFDHITGEQIFDTLSPKYILNILTRNNILDSLSEMGDKSVRNSLTDEFFQDLKSWVKFVDIALKDTPADEKARTISLINKLIFVRTMEGVGIIPNGYLATLWDNKKGVTSSAYDFIDHIDDDLSQIYDTELFSSKYILDENGEPVLKNGQPQYNKERQRNYAYKALPEDFFSAILKPITALNLDEYGKSRIRFKDKEFYLRSLYWWRFEAIPSDILGKAYETYLARERKKLGIYYTPHQMTEYLTSKTVNPVFDEKISLLKSELDKDEWDKNQIKNIANEIREIKICDPSCGSGSFLIQAMRIIWKKYREIEYLVKDADERLTKGSSGLDAFLDEKVGLIRFLEVLFRTRDNRERIGTLIVRHLFGNDKDIKAIDTAKLNIWLECLRLDSNSYRKEKLQGKHHVLPNLELNLTVGDSLVGLAPTDADKELSHRKDIMKSLISLREKYTESFDKTSIAKAAVPLRNGLQGFVNHEFAKKYGTGTTTNLLKILEPTHWSLYHFIAFYDSQGNLKPDDEMGFDVIIGNPPWEILEPNINEFYGPLYNSEELERFSLLTKQEKNKIIHDISKNPNNEVLWKKYNHDIDILQDFFKTTDLYKYQIPQVGIKINKIKMNLYKFFVEKYFQLLKKDGLAGVVLPSGVYTDLGSNGLRNLLYDKNQILSLYSFDNKRGIFEELHRQFKFITLVFRKGGKTSNFKSAFYIYDVNELEFLDSKALNYDIQLVRNLSPIALSIIECKNELEVKIFEKMSQFPILSDSKWGLVFQREFNMTDDAPLFNTKGNGVPLYEGKMIHQFTHTFKKPRYWIEYDKAKRSIQSRERTKLYRVLKKLKGKNIDKDNLTVHIPSDYYRLAWRMISNATDSRTIICTILFPHVFLGNSLNYIRPVFNDGEKFVKFLSTKELLYLCGMLNSFVIDFLMRRRVAINVNMFFMAEIPVPRLSAEDPSLQKISELVGSLICTTSEYDEIKNELKLKMVTTNEEDREDLMAQINAYAAKICGITKDEFEYILSTFPIVDAKIKQQSLSQYEKLA